MSEILARASLASAIDSVILLNVRNRAAELSIRKKYLNSLDNDVVCFFALKRCLTNEPMLFTQREINLPILEKTFAILCAVLNARLKLDGSCFAIDISVDIENFMRRVLLLPPDII